MKNISRLAAAAVLVGVLVVVAGGVWAAPQFQGTVPPVPPGGVVGGDAGGGAIDLGTAAINTEGCPNCTVTGEVLAADAVETLLTEAPPPTVTVNGQEMQLQVVSTPITVQIEGTGSVEIKFGIGAIPADKNPTVFKLDTTTTPPSWVAIPTVINPDGTVSAVITEGGTYAVMANP